jgi:O-antigen/teichoic acid export membrane protein
MRQLQYHRSLDPDDPMLGPLFAVRLKFTYGSAVVWFAGCVLLVFLTGDSRFIAIMPTTIWLAAEQTTTIWNAISIADGRSQALMPSYLLRRVPVVVALAVAAAMHLDTLWAWSLGLSLGSAAALVQGLRRQEGWARIIWPWKHKYDVPIDLDLGFWWFEVGVQIRDLDVTALSLVDAHSGGIYALPARLIRPMNLVTQATGSVAFPMLVRRKVITMRQLGYGVCASTLPVALVAAVVAACSPLIPYIVGHAYRESVLPMQILSIAAVLTGAMTMLVTYLTARSNEATRAAGYATLFAGLLQIGLAVVGGIWFGAVGAAVGATSSQAILFVILVVRSAAQVRIEQRERSRAPADGQAYAGEQDTVTTE